MPDSTHPTHDGVTRYDASTAIGAPDGAAGGTSTACPQPEAKRRRGGQPGNRSHFQSGLHSKKTKTELRDGPQRRAERRVRGILQSRPGLEADDLAEGVGDVLRMLWTGAYRLEHLHQRRGWTHKDGRPKESFTTLLSVIDKLGSNLARLIDRVAELQSQANGPAFGGDATFVCEFADGSPVFTNKPHVPGDALPLDLRLGAQDAPGRDAAGADDPDDTPTTERVLTPRAASSQKSVDAKVSRAVRRRPTSDEPERPPHVPASAVFLGNGQWQWSQGGVTYTTPPDSTARWQSLGEF